MQPYFLPYLGYFDLLNQADEWVVFDTPQYMKYGWVSRNRVLHQRTGWMYILVPLARHPIETPINCVQVAAGHDWARQILRQLEHYRRRAPYYDDVIAFLTESFAECGPSLAATNVALLRAVARRLKIGTPMHVYSEMGLALARQPESPTDWGVQIAKAMGATVFLNRPGGAAFISADDFRREGIALEFQTYRSMEYGCVGYRFQPDLSIVDVMMWNSPARIKVYLDTWRSLAAEPTGAECRP